MANSNCIEFRLKYAGYECGVSKKNNKPYFIISFIHASKAFSHDGEKLLIEQFYGVECPSDIHEFKLYEDVLVRFEPSLEGKNRFLSVHKV